MYPNSIAGKVKRQRQGTKRSAYTARREQSPPAESTGGDRQGPSPRKNDDTDSTSSTNLKAWTITKDSKKHVQIDGEMRPATGATYTADDDHNRDTSSLQGRYDDGAEDEEDSLFAGDDQEDTQTPDSINRSSCRAGRGEGGGRGRNRRHWLLSDNGVNENVWYNDGSQEASIVDNFDTIDASLKLQTFYITQANQVCSIDFWHSYSEL